VTDALLLDLEAARRYAAQPPLGLHTARALVATGEWKSVRIGRRVLILRSSVEEWARAAAGEAVHHGVA
jgi:excisionase family DNA binding protein